MMERRPTSTGARAFGNGACVEGLESRCLLSASLVRFYPVDPKTIVGGQTGYEVVTVQNPSADEVSDSVTISLLPSFNGQTVAGSYSDQGMSEWVSIKPRSYARIRVPFVTSATTLPAGKYFTLVDVDLNGTAIDGTAPGVYQLKLPLEPTANPGLAGTFSGMLVPSRFTGRTESPTHEVLFAWNATDQTPDRLTGTFTVGDQEQTGTMEGTQYNNGAIYYRFESALMNFTITGKVTIKHFAVDLSLDFYDTFVSGLFMGTLVDNLFSTLSGHFKLESVTEILI